MAPPRKPLLPLDSETKTKLLGIYSDPENRGSYGGVQRLYESAVAANLPVSKRQVGEWLRSQPTYTRYRNQRVNFERRPVVSFDLDHLWEVTTARFLDFVNQ